jgi:hypothetical protein
MMMKRDANEASRIKQHPPDDVTPRNEKPCPVSYDRTLETSILIITGSFLGYFPLDVNFGH